jgi:hypothetical protein
MNILSFHNSGTLDPRSFTMLGLSAKADDTAIGFFGTGFKYALACLVRSRAKVSVRSGTAIYTFSIKKDKFRGKEFDAIACTTEDGHEFTLPFAAHLGANWKMWQVYRELYTNCVLDEKGGIQVGPNTDADVCITVESAELMKVHQQHDTYFIPTSTKTHAKNYKMRCIDKIKTSENTVYYRSMFTGTKLEKPTIFTYDYITKVDLTEDRTIADVWYIKTHIGELWYELSTELLIKYLPLAAGSEFYESELSPYGTPPDEFMAACKYLIDHKRSLPLWAHKAYTQSVPFGDKAITVPLSRLQQKKLDRAIAILNHQQCFIDSNKLLICISLPNDLMGMYRDGSIYLARHLFDKGDTTILGTLYEEWLHQTEGCHDLTRSMQNLLVDKIANLMEEAYENAQA